MTGKPAPAAERFERHVDRNGPIALYRGAPGPCHVWKGSGTGSQFGQYGERYGQFWNGTRMVKAHRFAYEQVHGPIPATITDADGIERPAQADHRCRRRNCVNPAHIEIVSNRTNVLRSTGPTARNAAKERCEAGHDLTDPNNIGQDAGRRCLACKRNRQSEYRARQRAANDPQRAEQESTRRAAKRAADPQHRAKQAAHQRAYRARKRAEQQNPTTTERQAA